MKITPPSLVTGVTGLLLLATANVTAAQTVLNVKALNADGGFTFNLTNAPTINIDSQAFGGTWKAHHYYKAETTGAHVGTGRWATGIEHIAQGSTGASGASNLDGALWVEAGKLNWNTDQTIEGPITTLFVIGTNNAWSDLGGVIVNVSKPMTTTPGTFGGGGVDGNGNIVAWESTSRAYNMAGDTIIRDIHCLIGWDMVNLPGSSLAAGSNVGFLAEPVVGDSFSAFVANGRSDLAGTPDFQYLFVHSTNRDAANIDFHITGPKHADGAGRVRAGDGTTAKPAYSFDTDDDCGMFLSAANTVAFATNGVTRLTMDGGNVRSPLSLYAHNASAIPAGGTAGAGFRFSSTANFGVFFGSGAPTLSAAKGSLYLRSDGTTTNNRAYINTDGATTWTALTTAA